MPEINQTVPSRKRCPFCDAPALLVIDSDHHGVFYSLGCPVSNCIAHNILYTIDAEEMSMTEGIEKWNTRTRPCGKEAGR
jgi:hypothetical protein